MMQYLHTEHRLRMISTSTWRLTDRHLILGPKDGNSDLRDTPQPLQAGRQVGNGTKHVTA